MNSPITKAFKIISLVITLMCAQLCTHLCAKQAEAPTAPVESIADASVVLLQEKSESVYAIYDQLINTDNKTVILKGLKDLHRATSDLYNFLTSNDFYEPDLFFLSQATQSFLREIYDEKGKLDTCKNIKAQLEFLHRTPIEEQALPNPILWSIIKKACE